MKMNYKLAVLALVATGLLAGCGKGKEKEVNEAEKPKEQVEAPVEKVTETQHMVDDLVVSLEEKEITTSGSALFIYTLENKTEKEKKYTFNTGMQYDYTLYKDGEKQFTQSEVAAYTQVVTELTIAPNESWSFTVELGDLQPGNYSLEAWMIPNEAKEDFKEKIEFVIK